MVRLTILMTLCVFPSFTLAGSLIQRVGVVTAKPDSAALDELRQKLGNGYDVRAVQAEGFDPAKSHADVLVIDLTKESEGVHLADAALSAPSLDRVVLSSRHNRSAPAAKVFHAGADLLSASPSAAERAGQWALAIVQPDDAKLNLLEKLQGAWKADATTSEWRGHKMLTLEKHRFSVILPHHPRTGLHPVWMDGGGGDMDTLAARFLARGFPVVRFLPPAAPTTSEAALAQWRKMYELTTKAGLNRQGIIVASGDAAVPAATWANDDPWRIQVLYLAGQPDVSALLPQFARLAAATRNEKQATALVIQCKESPATRLLIEEAETAAGPSLILTKPPTAADFDWIHRQSQLMSAAERFASREPFVPQYAHLPAKETLARHAKSSWGDKPQRLRPGQNYFKGKPSGFDRIHDQWRVERKLARTDGKLTGPAVCLTAEELKTAPQPAVLLKDCVNALGELAWHWEEDCRNADDSARIQQLILDLTDHTTAAIRRWNDAETVFPEGCYDIKPLNRLAGISHILPPDQSEWLGRLALSGLKDRFKEEPYNDMDILRWTSTFPPSINFFRDPETKYAHLREIADYFDRTFHTNTGCGMEGTPQHHGLWHYSYASYSIGSGYGILHGFHSLGIHFSKNTYDRFKNTAVNMALLARPDLYDSVAPIAYNARSGIRCYLRWQPLADAALYLGDGKNDPAKPDPRLLAILAAIEPNNKALADLKAKGTAVSAPRLPVQTLVNAGALVSQQYGRVQATASGMSAPFGARTEIYMNWEGGYYSLYLKAGSLLLRSPAADNAETFDHSHGFDHSFIPGATSLVTTDRELFCRGTHTGVFTNGIGGGTRFADNDTAIVATHPRIGPMAGARKSYFFFGDRITALTSNVRRWAPEIEKETGRNSTFLTVNDPQRPVVTTLYQWPSEKPDSPGQTSQKPLAKALPLADRYGNAYIVHPNPATTWHTRSGPQSYISINRDKLKPGAEDLSKSGELRHVVGGKHDRVLDSYTPDTGHWTRAWIQHDNPDGSDAAACAYTVLVRGGMEKANALAAAIDAGKAPYQILQQDHRAHILRDTDTATTGCVIWEAGDLTNAGLLRSATGPCFLMLREDDAKSLSLSFVNADSNARRAVRLVIKGRWKCDLTNLPDGTRVTTAPSGKDDTRITLHAPPAEDFLTFGAAWTASYYQTRHLLPAVIRLRQ